MKIFSLFLFSALFVSSAFAQGNVKNVVFVHGAFADGSSWSKVISLLQKQGINAIAVQNPLSSLQDDVAAADRTINMLEGNTLLVGHSWGGTVITEAGDNEKVAGLVYVAALAPEMGQSTNESMNGFAKTPGLQALKPDAGSGYAWLTQDNFNTNFGQDVAAADQKILFATQGPMAMKAFDEKITVASYKNKPSWFIVTENDRMVGTDLQKAEAKRMNSQVTTVKSGHLPMIVKPQEVVNVITAALKRLNEQTIAPVKQAEEEI